MFCNTIPNPSLRNTMLYNTTPSSFLGNTTFFHDTSNSSLYVKATNKGAYLAYCIISYIYNGTTHVVTSPYIPVLKSFTLPLPKTVKEVLFYGLMCGPYFINFSGTGIVRKPICYEFYGTVFNPTCERVDC